MSNMEVKTLCNKLACSNMDGLCRSRKAFQQQVDASANAAAIKAASDEILHRVSDISAIAVYSIHGDVDQLLRVLIAASGLKSDRAPVVIVVDDERYEATLETFVKFFGDKDRTTTPYGEDWGSHVIVRGGPGFSKEPFSHNDEEAAQSLSDAAARVADALHVCTERMLASGIRTPRFVWHNTTSATLLTAISPNFIESRCQAVTFSSGLTLGATCFSQGSNYTRNTNTHDAAVDFCSANGIPFLYIDAEAMASRYFWLSNLPNYNTAWPYLFPESVWAKAIDNAKDRVTVRTMRWLHSTTSCKPAETTAKAGGYFSTPDGFLPSWGNEAFNNTSYTRCDIDAARSHAHNIAAKLKCPVNSVTGALAGMVVDQRPHEDCLAVPVNVDFASKGVSLQPLTTVKTFLLMVTSTKPEVDFTILWLKFLDIVRCRAPAVSGITVEAAESWMAFREQMKRPLVRIRRWEMKKEEEEGAMGDWGNEQWAQGAQGAWHALRRGDMYWTCQKRLH